MLRLFALSECAKAFPNDFVIMDADIIPFEVFVKKK